MSSPVPNAPNGVRNDIFVSSKIKAWTFQPTLIELFFCNEKTNALFSRFYYFLFRTMRIASRNAKACCFAVFALYFTGTSAKVFFSNSQNGAIVEIKQRSDVVCGERIVGPSETTSR